MIKSISIPCHGKIMTQPITLYLIGFAGTGKYTIAKELAKFGYKVIDNHLVNNPIFSLLDLDLDGEITIPNKAWEAIRKIRASVSHFISHYPSANYVFTNVLLEDANDQVLYNRIAQEAERRGSLFIPIKLHIAPDEHKKRIQNPQRKERFKATVSSPQEKQKGLIKIEHPYLLEIDVTDLSAAQAASHIMDFVKEIENGNKTTPVPRVKVTVRFATITDIPQIVSLSYSKRRAYEQAQPQFWKHAEGAEEAQTKWFESLVTKEDGIFLVAEVENQFVGFIRGQLENAPEVYDPGGVTLMIDDFCVKDPNFWPTVGQSLLQELKAKAKEKGASQVVVVSGHHDGPKRRFLESQGLTIASEWFVGGIEGS